MYNDSEWWGSNQHDRLLQQYFADSSIVIDNEFHSSQTVRDNRLVFGPWAGPLRCITHIMHEMCHLAEIDDARILKSSWGLTMPEQYVPGRYSRIVSVPNTWQGTQREVRVMAMQWQLHNAFGIRSSPRDILSSLKFMPDWYNVPHGLIGEYTSHDVDEARYQLLEKHLLNFAKEKYSLEFFNQEWIRKNNLLSRVSE